MSDSQELTIQSQTNRGNVALTRRGQGVMVVPETFGEVQAFAEYMSKGGIAVPKHCRDQPGVCMAIIMRATSWEMEPYAVASKTYSVNDILSYEAQLVAAVIHTRAPIVGLPEYEYEGEGDARVCTVIIKTTWGQVLRHPSPKFGKIHPKNSPLWKSDPDQQQGFYTIRALGRRYFPDLLMGVYTPEEMPAVAAERATEARSFAALEQRAVEGDSGAGEPSNPQAPPKPSMASQKPKEAAMTTGPQSGTAKQDTPASGDGREASAKDAQTSGSKDGRNASQPAETASPSEDDFPGDRKMPEDQQELQAAEESLQPIMDAAEDGFIDFVDYAGEIAAANDWPTILQALKTLMETPAFKEADADRQSMARRIAYLRLKDLTDGGYGFDFLTDLHAYRASIEGIDDIDALRGNWSLVKGKIPNAALPAFQKAQDRRIQHLTDNPPPPEAEQFE